MLASALHDAASHNGILSLLHPSPFFFYKPVNLPHPRAQDVDIDGPPPRELCLFPRLRELDLDGGKLQGPFPDFVSQCFPTLAELDMSYNRLTGARRHRSLAHSLALARHHYSRRCCRRRPPRALSCDRRLVSAPRRLASCAVADSQNLLIPNPAAAASSAAAADDAPFWQGRCRRRCRACPH